jgi:TonB-linked SusC/RagA family outer membrane protein
MKRKIITNPLSKTLLKGCLLLFLALFSTSLTAQITVDVSNKSIKEILKEIETKSEYRFFYNEDLKGLDKTASLRVKDASIDKTMLILLEKTEINYKLDKNNLVILVAKTKIIQRESKKINGLVTDSKGEPIIGASVVIKGLNTGTITNIDGTFSLEVQDQSEITISYIGYKQSFLKIGKSNNYKISLEEDSKALDEVVVVGYGTQKKKNLTGAVSTIRADEMQSTVATGVAQKLQGKVSGLNIRQNTGEPGSFDNAINIRGFGEPLYVVDGIVVPAMDFLKMNGEDIESLSVLKDATAAVYGMNAANGVVIVTTKHDTKGKTKFQFSTNLGWSRPTDQVKMANAYEYMTLRNEANTNFGIPALLSKDELQKWKEGGPEYKSTDWAAETFNQFASRQEYSLSAEGGTEKMSYYLNLNEIKDNGLYKTNSLNYNKLSFRSNITAYLTDNIKAIFNISGFFDQQETPASNSWNVIRGTVTSLPINSVYANNNPKYLNRVQDGDGINPVATTSTDLTGYTRNNNDNYKTSLELVYSVPFIKGLAIKGVGAYDKSFGSFKGLQKEYPLYDYDNATDTYLPTFLSNPSSIKNNYSNSYNLLLRGQADYKTTIKKNNNINATFVFEQKESFIRTANITKYYDFYTNDQIDQAGNTNASSGGNELTTRGQSYLGRLNYDYKGKYLLEFAGRYDGSYRYAPDRRWGFFPVVSGGWRISEENYMQKISYLSNLKIRGSYGKIGQDAGDPFQYIPGFTTGGGWYEFTNGFTTQGLNTPALVNKQLTWMTNTISDIGFDLGLFKNKLSITIDVYQKDRDGLLALRNVSLPNTYGGTFPQENLNKDRVRGVEFSFVHQNTIGKVNYTIQGNFNYNQTMAEYVEGPAFTDSWDYYQNQSVGRNSGIVWTYNVIGQFKSLEEIAKAPIYGGSLGNSKVLPGDYIYEDVNGDGVIDGKDLKPLYYDNNPRINFGLTLGANWEGFDCSIMFQGAAMFSTMMENAYVGTFYQESNVPSYYMDRWHKADPYDPTSAWIPGKYPAMRTQANYGILYPTGGASWRKDCSYLRLKNFELGYNFNKNLIKNIGFNNLRLFVNATNIYTWADDFIKPFDPERIAGAYNTGWIYPIQQTYTIGLTLNF